MPGDIAELKQCQAIADKAGQEFGPYRRPGQQRCYQMTHDSLEEITDEEWTRTFDINISAMFRLVKACLSHMGDGGSIINTSSVNSDTRPALLPYATTKGAIANFTAGLAQLLADRGIWVNAVAAPGPIWTPLIPSTMPPGACRRVRAEHPAGPGRQPGEVSPAYMLLASDEASTCPVR
jgi:NAD(P)-dependent dehydrogenase (short-subunit alcohol dehydrogenase family)